MPGTVKRSGGILSTVGTMNTGIVAVRVTARCLELNALEDTLEDALDRAAILASTSSRVARFSSREAMPSA